MAHDALVLAGTGWLLAAALMALLWIVHLPLRNAAIVDVGWSYSLPLLAVTYAVVSPVAGVRVWLLALLAVVWGGRLGTYLLFARILGQEEEGRYQELRRRWRTSLPLKFFVFFQAQAVAAVLLSAPFLVAALDPRRTPGPVELAAVLLWVVAVGGEALADRQLARFKADPASRGRVCRVGLWRYSRHPNYFFEWLVWVAYAAYAWPSPWGSLALIAPALIFYFLFRVTGIPATEEQALRSRGDEYREYQRTTSPFIPWFPRQAS